MMQYLLKPKPWVKPWMVSAACWGVFFPLSLFERLRDAWRWAIEDTHDERARFKFEEGGSP